MRDEHRMSPVLLLLPLPVGKLLAKGDFLELADGSARDGVEEDECVGELPLRKRRDEKRAQFLRSSACAVFQDNRRERALLPFRVRDANDAGLFHRWMT